MSIINRLPLKKATGVAGNVGALCIFFSRLCIKVLYEAFYVIFCYSIRGTKVIYIYIFKPQLTNNFTYKHSEIRNVTRHNFRIDIRAAL